MSELREEWNADELPALEDLRFYYDMDRTRYLVPEGDGWIPVNETGVRRHLMARGFSSKRWEGELLSALDAALNHVQLKKAVSFAGHSPSTGSTRRGLSVTKTRAPSKTYSLAS